MNGCEAVRRTVAVPPHAVKTAMRCPSTHAVSHMSHTPCAHPGPPQGGKWARAEGRPNVRTNAFWRRGRKHRDGSVPNVETISRPGE